MDKIKGFIRSEYHVAQWMYFAGFYVVSLAGVFAVIQGTQTLLGLI